MTLPDNDEPELTMFVARPRPGAAPVEELAHYVVIVAGQHAGKRVEVGATPVTVGRDAKQTLVLPDTEVSRLHARFSLVRDQVVAEDLGSTNGTFVDNQQIAAPVALRDGSLVRLGGHQIKYERRSRRDVERAEELDRDLQRASGYVMSLLPAPMRDGTVRAEWSFLPSAQLGGDAFGYHWLDQNILAFYLIDVSGHGVGAAMHSVTVLNLLRQRALPGVDFRNPAEVLASLNQRFQMDTHSGMYFTMWYGVYHTGTRTLLYGSAGHHPAYLVPAPRGVSHPLGQPALMIGAVPDIDYAFQQTTVPANSSVYLFSDGVFEIVTREGGQWGLNDFLPLLAQPLVSGTPEPERLRQAVLQAARPGPLDDDFSLLVVTFP